MAENDVKLFEQNLDMEEEINKNAEEIDEFKNKIMHITIQQLSGRKKATVIKGFPDDIDIQLVLKAWKKLFHCVGSVKEDKKDKEFYIVLNGDHRQEVNDFLIHEGIVIPENIKIHGLN